MSDATRLSACSNGNTNVSRASVATLATITAMAMTVAGCGASETQPAGPMACSAPADGQQLQARVQQLREHYAPYLQSLPQRKEIRQRADLSGTWRSKWEVEDFVKGPRPQAPNWHTTDLDDANWTPTTVPEWRYDQPEPPGTRPDPKAHRANSRILWYRTTFAAAPPPAGRRAFLNFAGVAWEAQVWLNGVKLGDHMAYWEPFRFDVTGLLKEKNVLAVRVLSGEALGEPVFGWSVLPCVAAEQPRYVRDANQSVIGQRDLWGFRSSCFLSGIGIHREVFLETAGATAINEVFVRGDLTAGEAKVRVETDAGADGPLTLDVQILAENFHGQGYAAKQVCSMQRGAGGWDLRIPTPSARSWQQDEPCLYRCRVTLRDGDRDVDSKDVLFGFRSFRIVTAAEANADRPEGMFLLNGEPVYLRGAGASPALNAFWYWRQDDKLLNAVLMMKAANFNAVRANEYVQFPEVRELMDRLGMLCEQDLSGAGDGKNDLAGRLARQCYNNPGVVLLTTGMETDFDPTAIVAAMLKADPQRIVKPISGHMKSGDWSYNLPPEYPQLPKEMWNNVIDDFHSYAGWYRRGADMAALCRIYPPGRMVTMGEFGAEAMDDYATMKRHPAALQPPPITADSLWTASQVKRGDPKMTVGLRGREPATLGQFIEASQTYQADVLAEQATGMRLSPRRISGSFVFHFIDGLPAMWPKSIVSYDLTPKKALFAMAQVNQPIVPLFQILDEGKTLALWVANDRNQPLPGGHVAWSVCAGGKALLRGQGPVDVRPLDATPVTKVDLSAILAGAPVVEIALALTDATGKTVSRYSREVYLRGWQAPQVDILPPPKARVSKIADAGGDANNVDWSKAATLTGWRQIEGLGTGLVIDARVAHDGRFLYVRLSQAARAAGMQSEDGVWGGEDWEVFIGGQRAKPYRQIGVNPKGKFVEVTTDPNLPLCKPAVVSTTADDRWTVLFALPLETVVPGGLKSGSVFYANFHRVAGSGETYRQMLSWSPAYKVNFHMPEAFGELTLE